MTGSLKYLLMYLKILIFSEICVGPEHLLSDFGVIWFSEYPWFISFTSVQDKLTKIDW